MNDSVVDRLRAAGCVAAEEEASELEAIARDAADLDALVERRVGGEPLAWITGRITFCGLPLAVDPGVYVPRWQTEVVALAAAARHTGGWAVDLCTGCGAVAAVLGARGSGPVVATDVDSRAVACAGANGVPALVGDLFEPLSRELRGHVEVVVAVAPYVPTRVAATMHTPEPRGAIDGGRDGLLVTRRVVAEAPEWLRNGGSLVLEVGRPQVATVAGELRLAGFDDIEVLHDPDGDVCGVVAVFRGAG